MAGPNPDEEFIAIDGIVATGVHGVAVAPTNATSPLGATWTDHGLTTAAGVTTSEQVSVTVRRAWQNGRKLRRLVTEAAVRFTFVLVQTTRENVQLFHGVPLIAGSLVRDPAREWPLIAFDFDKIDGSDVIREFAPSARVVEIGEQIAVAGDGWGWPITIESEYDDDLGGHTQQFYSAFEGAEAVPTITTALPASKGAGDTVTLVGTGFTGTTGVTIGGVAVTGPNTDVISDTELHITLPAGTAGSAPIIVTNASGPSAAKAYTRIT